MKKELYQRAEDYGNGLEGWIRALRESAERMVQAGEIKGYLAYDNGIAIGWCNSNDRMSYYRTGEFDLHTLPDDEEYTHNIAPGEVKAIVCFEISQIKSYLIFHNILSVSINCSSSLVIAFFS